VRQRERAVKGSQDKPSREGVYTQVDGVLVESERRFLTAVLERAHRSSFKF
jgi:hypothetical protein